MLGQETLTSSTAAPREPGNLLKLISDASMDFTSKEEKTRVPTEPGHGG